MSTGGGAAAVTLDGAEVRGTLNYLKGCIRARYSGVKLSTHRDGAGTGWHVTATNTKTGAEAGKHFIRRLNPLQARVTGWLAPTDKRPAMFAHCNEPVRIVMRGRAPVAYQTRDQEPLGRWSRVGGATHDSLEAAVAAGGPIVREKVRDPKPGKPKLGTMPSLIGWDPDAPKPKSRRGK